MVESLYFVPQWFYQIDIALSIIFVVVSAVVASYAIKLYRLTDEREFGLFGVSFACLSLSYLMRGMLNSFLSTAFQNNPSILLLRDINLFSKGIIYIYVLLFIIGYLTLFYTTLKIKGHRVYAVLLALSMSAFAMSLNKSLSAYLIAAVFLVGIVYHYARLCITSKGEKGRSMLLATALLLVSTLQFMLIADYHFYKGYIISNILELAAYIVVGYRLYRILGYGEKKK